MEGTKARSTCWSVTINNPTEEDEECIHLARARGWKVEGQKEVGKEGTPHYQLIVRTPQVRFGALKKQFPRGHIEPARNPTALAQYTQKQETRVGELPTSSEMYPSVSRTFELVYGYFMQANYVNLPEMDSWWEKETEGRDTLDLFDEAIGHLIMQGYYVEHHGVNPQVRGSFKRWPFDILRRTEHQVWSRVQREQEQIATVNITQDADAAPQDDP